MGESACTCTEMTADGWAQKSSYSVYDAPLEGRCDVVDELCERRPEYDQGYSEDECTRRSESSGDNTSCIASGSCGGNQELPSGGSVYLGVYAWVNCDWSDHSKWWQQSSKLQLYRQRLARDRRYGAVGPGGLYRHARLLPRVKAAAAHGRSLL
jgi:hypothetical protein